MKQTQTPLYDAVDQYIQKEYARFHMPGHKGKEFLGLSSIEPWDVTEVSGTDSLYHPREAILRCEEGFASLYGTARTLLSAGGSTLCIQTMLSLVAKPGSSIIAGRNLHTSAVSTMALLDLSPVWLYPQGGEGIFAGVVTPQQVEKALWENRDASCVYITSPDYFGVLSDIQAISGVCKKYQVPLLVDNAHGAHLRFLPKSLHPMDLGADICCDSLHKTLPVLTGGAVLHMKTEEWAANAKEKMAIFGSTSPSYLIMLSCDKMLSYLPRQGKEDIALAAARVDMLKTAAQEAGFGLPSMPMDPMRLTVILSGTGYDEASFRRHLISHRVEAEYLSDAGGVFLVSAFHTQEEIDRLKTALLAAKVTPSPKKEYPLVYPKQVMSMRQAVFAQQEKMLVQEAVGRVMAQMIAPCPPGIPLVMPGEMVEANDVEILKKYGIYGVNVIK